MDSGNNFSFAPFSGQVVIFFVMDMLQELPGLPGLFIACVFSAALRCLHLLSLFPLDIMFLVFSHCCYHLDVSGSTISLSFSYF